VLGERGFSFRTPAEWLVIRVDRFGVAPGADLTELNVRFLRSLRWGLDSGDSATLALARDLDSVLSGGSVFGSVVPSRDGEAETDLFRRLELATLRGRISVEREPLFVFREPEEAPILELPPLPRPARESPTTSFEVRFVDEAGRPLNGLPVELTVGTVASDRTSNAAGVALIEDATSSSAELTLVDAIELDKIVDPRWERPRRSVSPPEPNTTHSVFTGADLGRIALKPVVPNVVVIRPPAGRLFVELLDKTGKIQHSGRRYQIDGPQSFEGKTDTTGRLQHDEVFPGDYTLKFFLEFFEGKDQQTDEYETQLVVLPAGTSTPETRMLGVTPFSVLARLHLFFNTNKVFLLPTALPGLRGLRSIQLENRDNKLLVVGHADTTGGPSVNDPLSLERAKATIAFLKDDVDAWLKYYEAGQPKDQQWGRAEDRMMLIALPDFPDKPKGQEAVKWFQTTRGLTVDGKAGPQTRRQLITEYMELDGPPLSELGIAVDAVAHGCGENFPIDDSGEALDPNPEDEKKDQGDRRVELFFFDPEFGIVPLPPGENSPAGSTQYPAWRKSAVQTHDLSAGPLNGPKLTFVELLDSHFRTNSAVVLPEGEAPNKDSGKLESLSSVGVFATALRFLQEHPTQSVFVAGHCDTTGAIEFNQTLSEERAQCALSLLIGGEEQREIWKTLCDGRHQVSDYKQILAWVSQAFPDLEFDCDPGKIDDNEFTGIEPVRNFQNAYNANKDALGATADDLEPDGDMGPLTWGAIFDCYEHALREELGEDEDGLAALREGLVFVDPDRKALGFSEHFPIEELGVDNYKSQLNRRVEILFFEPGEEPDLAAAEDDPETSELYLPGHFERTPLGAMASAKPWKARWTPAEPARTDQERQATLLAPGLPAGTPLELQVFCVVPGSEPVLIDQSAVVAGGDGASVAFADWFSPDAVPPDSSVVTELPEVTFRFVYTGGGRIARSDELAFADSLDLRFVHRETELPAAEAELTLHSPFGLVEGKTDAEGKVTFPALPPGGARVVLRDFTLVIDHD
jgi:outer membrane protein OmpA-like peptidoglycan-associated protein